MAITRPIKKKLRKRIEKKYNFELEKISSNSHARQAKFAIYAPELSRESAMRSSRDRIARGAIINSIIATIIVIWLHFDLWFVIIGCSFILISILMWIGFERISYAYELNAEKAVDLKIEYDKNKNKLVLLSNFHLTFIFPPF